MKTKLTPVFAAALSATLLLASCSKTEAPASTKPEQPAAQQASQPAGEKPKFEKTKVRVAYMPNMGSASSTVAALTNGHFEEMGLEVELTLFNNGPDEIAAMASGDIDIAQIGHGAHKLAIEGKADIFQMDATSLADAVIGNAARGVKTLADLKGKTVASTLGTSADIILKLALQEAGLTVDDINLTEIDASGVVAAMTSGQIDACATWSPATGVIAKQLGQDAVTLATNATYVDKATFPSSFITTKNFAKDHRDVLVRFAAAIQRGQMDRINQLDEVAKATAKKLDVPEQTMLESKNEGNWATSGAEFFKGALADGTIKKFYENQQEIFRNAGVVKEKVEVDQYIHLDIMKEANALALK